MYSVSVQESPVINVKAGRHEAVHAVDGSAMNLLEAFYAALAGCAAVFAKKACKELGISPLASTSTASPSPAPGGPLTLSKFKTEVRFPEHFSAEQRRRCSRRFACAP